MVLTVVLLDAEENFIGFLNPELISLEETCEKSKLNSLVVEYFVEDFENAKKNFKLGHKLYISGDKTLTDRLYVMNTSIERDYFKENKVVFEVEDVLVELNYVLFNPTEVTAENGFTVTNDGIITLDRNALAYWFGDHFQIGIIQNPLDSNLLKIHPKSTMTLMDLLRYIEEHTSNVFITRYEKDAQGNLIHRYLDFLNPNDADNSWEAVIDYDYPVEEEVCDLPVDEFDYTTEVNRVPIEDLVLKLVKNNNTLFEISADELGFEEDYTDYEITLHYNKPELTISVVKEAENDDTLTFDTVENTVQDIELPSKLELQLYDTNNEKVIFSYGINARLGLIHEDTLDLRYNTENIVLEINETDTYKAIAPILTVEDLTHTQLNTVIQDWLDLEVEKGSLVPMIVQRINASTYPSTSQNVSNNYWHKPVKTTNNDGNKEYDRATAYWNAPFSKVSGELFVVDDTDTGTEYNTIFLRPDLELNPVEDNNHHVKIGNVETSDTDKYAIFNDVCQKLKDKRYPELNISVDVANYKDGTFNNYDLHDRVYVKIPTFENLVIATVSKTVKNANDIGTNTIELSNYSINTRTSPKESQITADNVEVTYPKKFNLTAKLEDTEDDPNPLNNKLVSVTVLKKDGESYAYTGTTYNRETNNNGEITIKNMSLKPGDYRLECNFGGDSEYESSTVTAEVNVEGIYYNTTNQKIVSEKITWSKYGHSPKGKYVTTADWAFLKDQESKGNLIMAIGNAVTTVDKKKWGNKLIETVFERKCPHCGSTKLYWGYGWVKKSDNGYFKPTKTIESGAKTGRIICSKCGASYDVCGNGGNKKLITSKSTKKSDKSRLNKLKSGKLPFGTVKKIVSKKNVAKNTGTPISRATPTKQQSGKVAKKVKERAKNIVGGDTGVKAAKLLAQWISKNIKTEDRIGFYQTPSKTLSRKKGNDACKTDLLIQMCDAVGVQNSGIGVYYVYTVKTTKSKKKTKSKSKKKKTSHVFAKINGKWVDVCKKNPWGHYQTGYGAVKNATITRYPQLPFTRKYN